MVPLGGPLLEPLPAIWLLVSDSTLLPGTITSPWTLSTIVVFAMRSRPLPPPPPAWLLFRPEGPAALRPPSLEREAANHDDVEGIRVDVDRDAARREDGGEGPRAVEGDRLGDGHCTIAAGVECVDLAAARRLADG